MIILLGAASFNARYFLETSNNKIYCLIHKNIPTVRRENVIYIKNVLEIKNISKYKDITVINFANSYNVNNKFFSLFFSNFFTLFLNVLKLNRKNIVNVINIGSYWQNSNYKYKNSYIIVKNFCDFVFLFFFKSVNYINLKIGDVIDLEDQRDKLVRYLLDNKGSKELILESSGKELLFPISRKQIAQSLEFLLLEKDLFKNNQIQYVSLFKKPITLSNFVEEFNTQQELNLSFIFKRNKPKRKYDFQKNNDFCLII